MEKLQNVQVGLKLSLDNMLTVIEEELHPEPYKIEEISDYLGINVKELRTQILSQNTQDGECVMSSGIFVHTECLYLVSNNTSETVSSKIEFLIARNGPSILSFSFLLQMQLLSWSHKNLLLFPPQDFSKIKKELRGEKKQRTGKGEGERENEERKT